MYTTRKCVVEHPFGTIKRSLDYNYFPFERLMSVNTEASFIFLTYNLK